MVFNLYEAARIRRREAHRPGTRKNLWSCQKLYLQFAIVFKIPILSPGVDDLAVFAEWLIAADLSVSMVQNYISAVKNMYLGWGTASALEIFDSYAWALTIKAINFSVRPKLDSRTAVSPQHLAAMVKVCSGNRSLLPLRVALIFGFMGFLRVSNLAPYTAEGFDCTRHTTRGDVKVTKAGIVLMLKWTKTRQAAKETAPVPLPALGDPDLCPLSALEEYVGTFPGLPPSPDSPLLVTTVEPMGKIVTVPMLRALMRRVAQAAGLAEQNYTPHSLRRGGASCSFHNGVPLDSIKRHGT